MKKLIDTFSGILVLLVLAAAVLGVSLGQSYLIRFTSDLFAPRYPAPVAESASAGGVVVSAPVQVASLPDPTPVPAEHPCTDCDLVDIVTGAPAACETCHENVRPTIHFQGTCSTCHSSGAWKPAHFNHQDNQAVDCQTCHESYRPLNHYVGQCSTCHTQAGWIPASFDHQANQPLDCQSCHKARRPAVHYEGQCSLCHTTAGWKPASFDHTAATTCAGCHEPKRPSGHYSGDCSLCHQPGGWLPASFNHTAAGVTTCAGCHESKRPANHFPGDCSQCHKPGGWKANHASASPAAGSPPATTTARRPPAPAATNPNVPPTTSPATARRPHPQRLETGQLQPQRRDHLRQLPRTKTPRQPLFRRLLALPQTGRLAAGHLQPQSGGRHHLCWLP